MSPIYERITQIDRIEKTALKKIMNGTYKRLVHQGFAFRTQAGDILEAIAFDRVTDEILEDAKKPESGWSVLYPEAGSSINPNNFAYNPNLEGKQIRGSAGKRRRWKYNLPRVR